MMIRVLIVEDSKLMALKLKDLIIGDSSIEVVGMAHNGVEAIRLNESLKPDVITMDLNMDQMDGLEATKQIMGTRPTPILIVSSAQYIKDSGKVFTALTYGAVEVFDKNLLDDSFGSENKVENLIEKIHLLSKIKVLRHPLSNIEVKSKGKSITLSQNGAVSIVGIAASTGGPQALSIILKELPCGFPYPILVVQHIVPYFTPSLCEWLNSQTSLQVKVAEANEKIIGGHVYLAPAERQMKIDSYGHIDISDSTIMDGQIPSGTALFESMAKYCGSKALGIILTGMGRDGASGLKKMKEAGATVVGQDEDTCIIYGMPRVAKELGAVDHMVPIHMISNTMKQWAGI